MTSRERLRLAINHKAPDKIPFDIGSTSVTGIHASAYAQLKRIYKFKDGVIKIIDPYQMLAEVENDVKQSLGIDTYGIQAPYTLFGFRNEKWKPWKLFDGTEVMVPGRFEYSIDEKGNVYIYPQGDKSVSPSGKMAKDGYYFDAIIRQKRIDESRLDPKKWVMQTFSLYTDEDLRYLENVSKDVFENTPYAIIGNFCDGGLGDVGVVPAMAAKDPDGIRDIEEWYLSHVTRKSYIKDIFYYQTELAIENLKLYKQACDERIFVIDVSMDL